MLAKKKKKVLTQNSKFRIFKVNFHSQNFCHFFHAFYLSIIPADNLIGGEKRIKKNEFV